MQFANFEASRTGTVHRGATFEDGQLNHLHCGANGIYKKPGMSQTYRATTKAVTCKTCAKRTEEAEAPYRAPAATPTPVDAQDAVTAGGPFHGVTVAIAPQTTPSGAFLMCELREGGEVPQARLSGLTTDGECGTLADWAASAGPAMEGSPSTIAACDFHLAAAVRYLTAIRTGDINPATGRSRDAEDLEAAGPGVQGLTMSSDGREAGLSAGRWDPAGRALAGYLDATGRAPLQEGGPEWEALTSTGPEPEFTRAGAIVGGVDVPAEPARLEVPVRLNVSADRHAWATANGLDAQDWPRLRADLFAYVTGELQGDLPGMLTEARARVVNLEELPPSAPAGRRQPPHTRVSVVVKFVLSVEAAAWASTAGLDPTDTAELAADVHRYVTGQMAGTVPGMLAETGGQVKVWTHRSRQ